MSVKGLKCVKGAMGPRSQMVVALAARPQGVTPAEMSRVTEQSRKASWSIISAVIRLGYVWPDKSAGFGAVVYRTHAGVDWSHLAMPDVPPEPHGPPKPRDLGARQYRMDRSSKTKASVKADKYRPAPTKPAIAAPVQIKARPDMRPAGDRAIVPKSVKVQQCPHWTHDVRFQAAPGEPVFGAGFAAVGIGRDVTTGEGW